MSLDRRSGSHSFPLAPRGGVRRIVLLIVCAAPCATPAAWPQTAANVMLASEYSMRGLSLSEGRPVVQLRLDHDSDGGWYAGGFVSPVRLPASQARAVLIAYGGRARRFGTGLGWDLGASQTAFLGEGGYNYREFYGALTGDRGSVRIAFSPDYYGAGRTAYAELNGAYPLAPGLSLSGHAGWLHWFRRDRAHGRADLRAAIVAELGDASLQLGLQARQRDPGTRVARARALFASLSLGF